MMKWIICLSVIILHFGCGKDDSRSYPVLYTLDHIEQSEEGHFLVEDTDQVSGLSTDIGSFGAFKDDIKQETLEGLEIVFNLQEIELQSDDSLRINFFIEEDEFDLTLGYSRINGDIVIDSLEGNILTYEKDEDQFVVCSKTTFSLPGPNVNNPGHFYYSYDVSECMPGFTLEDYAIATLNENLHGPLDTIGVLLTRQVFK